MLSHNPDGQNLPTYADNRSARARRAGRSDVARLLVRILEDAEISGPVGRHWTIKWWPSNIKSPLTPGEIRGWLECHRAGRAPDKLVATLHSLLCSTAAMCHAEAECAAHIAQEKAIDRLHDLIAAQTGGTE